MTERPAPLRATVLATLALLVAAGCAHGARRAAPEHVSAGEGNRDWYAGTPEMQARLAKLVAQIPGSSAPDRIRIGRDIVSLGEPAVPVLVRALEDPSPDTRGTAAWLLGFLGDPRSSSALVHALDDPAPLVRYEAASSLLRMKDDRGLYTAIAGLEDPDPLVRSKCLLLLEDATGETFGFRADQEPDERAAAVARWRAWAAARKARG